MLLLRWLLILLLLLLVQVDPLGRSSLNASHLQA